MALEGKDRSVTVLLEASATGQGFFNQVFSSNCSRKHFYITSVYFLLGFKVRFTLRWLKSRKLVHIEHGKA